MQRTVNVACIGDSLTQGGYPSVLQELLKAREPSCEWRVHNLGFLGADTKDWLERYLASSKVRGVAAAGVDVYCVMLGTNDAQVKLSFNEQHYRERLTQIGRALMNEGVPVLLISPPPVEPGAFFTKHIDVRVANTMLPRIVPEIANGIGCGFADAFSALGGAVPKHEALADGVHLTQEGNRLVANAVLNAVLNTVMRTGGGNSSMRAGRGNSPLKTRGSSSSMGPRGRSPTPLPFVAGASSNMAVLLESRMLDKVSAPATPGPRTPLRQPSQLEAVTPSYLPQSARPSQSNGYSVGEPVEVFSNTFDAWILGRIARVEGKHIMTTFVAPDGKEKEKWMPIGHPQMRLVAVVPIVQATTTTTTTTSPMNGAIPRSSPNGAGLSLQMPIPQPRSSPHGAASVAAPMNGANLGFSVRSPARGVGVARQLSPAPPAFNGQAAHLARSGSQYPAPAWGDCRSGLSAQTPPMQRYIKL